MNWTPPKPQIIDLSLEPELSRYADELIWAHDRMQKLGHHSYELGPYATRDIVEAMRKDINDMLNWIDDGTIGKDDQHFVECMRAKYPKNG